MVEKKKGIPLWFGLTVIPALFLIFVIFGSDKVQQQATEDRVNLKDFMYHCLDTMPKNETQFCVQSALGRKFKFDDVEAVLKQYVAEHPEQQKKKKKS